MHPFKPDSMGIDKILIADSDTHFLAEMRNGLDKLGQFRILTALDGVQALAVLRQDSVSILVTCLSMPRMDGLELLAAVSREFPNILSIVTTSFRDMPLVKQADGDSIFSYLNKPFSHIRLHGEIIRMLDYRDEISFQAGMFLSSMLPLINLEQKTCLLEISVGRERKGYFYFRDGIICDVRCGSKAGSEALEEMLHWGPGRYQFKPLPDDPAVREFHEDLTSLIMDGTLFKRLKTPPPRRKKEVGSRR
jgi:CheY-like chemotaxis protein